MRLALLTDGLFPFVVGGMQKHSYYLAKYLARQGIYVDLYYALYPDVRLGVHEKSIFKADEEKFVRTIRVERRRLPYFPGHYIRESCLTSRCLLKALERNSMVDFIYTDPNREIQCDTRPEILGTRLCL